MLRCQSTVFSFVFYLHCDSFGANFPSVNIQQVCSRLVVDRTAILLYSLTISSASVISDVLFVCQHIAESRRPSRPGSVPGVNGDDLDGFGREKHFRPFFTVPFDRTLLTETS